MRYPDLFKSVAEHVVGRSEGQSGNGRKPRKRGFGDFSPQGVGNLCWAFAKQGQLATQVSERSEVSIANTNGRLSVYATSYMDIGEVLLQRLFSAAAESALVMHGKQCFERCTFQSEVTFFFCSRTHILQLLSSCLKATYHSLSLKIYLILLGQWLFSASVTSLFWKQ